MQQKDKIKKNSMAKAKSLGGALLLTFICSLSTVSAQTMYVNESNGTQTAYALSNVRKMSFLSGNLTITKNDNSSVNYALNGLRYLNFTEDTTGMREQKLIQETLIAYPNPVANVLNIDLSGAVRQYGTLTVFNIEGKTIITREVKNESVISLDMSYLPKGIYLFRYSNSVERKIIKIVKQ